MFLEDFHWQGEDLEDRRLRIRLAEPLAHEVLRLPALQGRRLGRAVGRVEATVRHAVWMVRQEREAARRMGEPPLPMGAGRSGSRGET